MLQITENRETMDAGSSFREQFLDAYRFMLQARLLDDKMASLYRGGKIHGGVFLSRGQEALSVSIGLSLRKGDIFAPLIRDSAGRLAFGEPMIDAVRTYMGSILGPMRGRDGNVHRGRPLKGLLPMISHLGATISVVNGMLLGRRFKKTEGTVGAASIGDGASSTGAFHEAMNQAAVEKLPLVVVLANNQFAYSTPNSRQFACRDLVDKAVGYGMTGHSANGPDLTDCLSVVGNAINLARAGKGPQLVVANLLRLCGHGEHDDSHYIDAKMKQSALGQDCLTMAENKILQLCWSDSKNIKTMRREVAQQIDEIVATVQREPAPDPYRENWCALASRHLSGVFEEPSGEA